MINRDALTSFVVSDLLAEFNSIQQLYQQQFAELTLLPDPPTAQLYFSLGLEQAATYILENSGSICQASLLPIKSPLKFELSATLMENKGALKASKEAIAALQNSKQVLNQLQIDKQFLLRQDSFSKSRQLLKQCLEESRWGKKKEDIGPENKCWRKVQRKQQNLLVPRPIEQWRGPRILPYQHLVLRFAVYSSITGKKSLEYLTTSESPISDIRKLPNLCLVENIYQKAKDQEAALFYELMWIAGRTFTREKGGCLQDNKDNGWLGQPWKQVRIELGAGCLYRHLGGCDHMVVLVDAHPPQNEEQTRMQNFPVQVFRSRVQIRRCEACEGLARVAVVGRQTNLLCEECCREMGLDQSEKVYPYFGA